MADWLLFAALIMVALSGSLLAYGLGRRVAVLENALSRGPMPTEVVDLKLGSQLPEYVPDGTFDGDAVELVNGSLPDFRVYAIFSTSCSTCEASYPALVHEMAKSYLTGRVDAVAVYDGKDREADASDLTVVPQVFAGPDLYKQWGVQTVPAYLLVNSTRELVHATGSIDEIVATAKSSVTSLKMDEKG